jgi:hypothetical protein
LRTPAAVVTVGVWLGLSERSAGAAVAAAAVRVCRRAGLRKAVNSLNSSHNANNSAAIGVVVVGVAPPAVRDVCSVVCVGVGVVGGGSCTVEPAVIESTPVRVKHDKTDINAVVVSKKRAASSDSIASASKPVTKKRKKKIGCKKP